ncbi:pectin methylesterase [Alteromonas mediterranea]|uniref:pectinesterase family protein n=1 Tax=Alteromonas mediterranea TaxID=314275 RepID=UPI000903DF65|nr:pectinesterase family protein [Alteromonas mediterranea]APE03558.1 pectin methylesterase [Alteromonas mediterranea]
MKLTKIAALMSGVILVTACGEKSSTNVTLPPDPALTGVFVDSPVEGINYTSASVENGATNAQGEYSYFRGEQIAFSIGQLTFPETPASSVISPLDLFATDNPFNQSVVNTLRLLQSLDTDGDPSNGISLSASAGDVAVATLDEGQTIEDFFNQSDADFAADVEVWLGSAGGASVTLVDKAQAISHFVNYLEAELGTLFPNTFDVTRFTGDIYAPTLEGRSVSQATYTFTPDDETNLSGTFVRVHGEESTTGNYEFSFGRKVIALSFGEQTEYLISRAFNTVNEVYSLCVISPDNAQSMPLVLHVESCLANEDPQNYLFAFTQEQADVELAKLEEAANSIQAALEENFDTDTDTFFSSSYKRLSEEPDAGALYYVTGGSPLVDATTGQLTLEGDRFSIGNAAANPGANTSASDTVGMGIYNLSGGFTISFDVISHNGGGTFSLYVDNNTTGQDNSVHGAASKFVSEGLADSTMVPGTRFTYTYEPGDDIGGGDPSAPDAKILDSSVTNSFFQLRTDSSATITIDNLKIETVADAVDPVPPVEPEPTEPEEPEVIPSVPLPLSYTFAGESEDIFSTNYAAIENAAGEQVAMFTITGGSVTQIDTGIQLDGGRFTLGNTEPDTQSSSDDTSSTGALDLSRPYKVIFDVISAEDSEGDNKFQIYVDNDTSGSANSHLGSDSRFFNEPVLELEPGTTMTVEGQIATPNSYLQFRTESGSIVVIDNIRIEYIDENTLLEETFETDADTFFSPEYKSTDGGATPFYSVTGGGSGLVISEGQLAIDSARFTMGNSTPDTDTTADDTTTTGILDLSREYTISMDIIAVEDSEGDNNFQIYVDNNTSSSSKSIHGGDSKFYSELVNNLVPGQRLTIDGFIGTPTSFLQLRTESGGKVVIDNFVISYVGEAPDDSFTMPTATYGDLFPDTTPYSGNNNAYTDTLLSLTFDSEPTLGSSGEVRIYNAADDTLVDVINIAADEDFIGFEGQDRQRKVAYRPASVVGNTLVIKPHTNALQYGQSYYVAISDGAVTGATLNGESFSGIGKSANWHFATRAAAPSGANVTVDDDGEADFRTVQGALNYVMQNVSSDTPSRITIRDGEYQEMLFLRGKNNVTLQGESQDNTVVYYDNFESFNSGSGKSEAPTAGTPSGGRSVFLVEGVDNLTLTNFTLKNSHIRSNDYSNQAETIYFNSDSGRLTAVDMSFVSEQDTLQLKGFSWFYNSLIAGNVDFIWGYVNTALFENSEIRTIGDSKNGNSDEDTAGGYILQARVPDISYKGFIFLNSSFTNGPGPIGNGVLDDSTYIARSGGSASYFDNITLINNRFDTHIATIGWAGEGVRDQPAPNPSPATAAAGWREYGSMDMQGNPLDLSSRQFAHILADSEVTELTSRTAIFSHFNNGEGWVPSEPDLPNVAPAPTLEAYGFAQYNYALTGGAGGTVVTVDNGADLQAALDSAANSNTPVTVYVDGTITDANNGGTGAPIEIKDMNDVSIIGVANRGEFDGIGILIRRANNVIIQNLKIHHVLTDGKDAISIEGDNDGSTTSNIWIDHNELYSTLSVDKDFYDGLVDSKRGAKNITISYNYLHDHWKASLHGHTENDVDSNNTERLITFHHNRFENIESRLPLFRYGHGHLYNNYYNQISSTAINSRIGAELQVENNVFENTQNPIVSFYSDVIGYWNTSGNLFGEGVTWTTPADGDVVAGPDATPTSSYEVPYDYVLDDAEVVKQRVINYSGVGKINQNADNIPSLN